MGPSLVAWPGRQHCCGRGVEGHWPEPRLCSAALGLQQWFGDQVFPGLGPVLGWSAGSLGSVQEPSGYGGV